MVSSQCSLNPPILVPMTKANILIAEDDPNFGMVLKSYLALNDYEVVLCEDGNKAYAAFLSTSFDLCIFDVMMPYRDGFSLAEAVQKTGKNIPFVFLTAKSLKEDQIRGYQLGAIDYLVKPFDPEILILKVQAILNQHIATPNLTNYRIGNFSFDFEKRELSLVNNFFHQLSPKEAELLKLLCEKKGMVLKREEALLKIWKEDNYFTGQSMNVYVTKLRKYLKKDTTTTIEILNVHGKGFILRVQKH